MTNNPFFPTIDLDDARIRASLMRFREFFDSFADAADPLTRFHSLDNLIADGDFTRTFHAIEINRLSIAIYFDLDTCPHSIIATFDETDAITIRSIQLSADELHFIDMIPEPSIDQI